MITRDTLCDDMRRIGVHGGQRLEVHSSLRQIGWVDGGAVTVVQALMDVVTPTGTLVMSAYPVSKPIPLTAEEQQCGLVAKVRLYDLAYRGASGMGVIADAFRDANAVLLGPGFHRVAAWGRDATRYCAGYQELYADDGWALLMGVDITRMSSMHLAEVGITQSIDATTVLPASLQRQYPSSDWYLQYRTPGTPVPVDTWLEIQAQADVQGWIRRGLIGHAPSMLVRIRPVIDMYRQRLLHKCVS